VPGNKKRKRRRTHVSGIVALQANEQREKKKVRGAWRKVTSSKSF
jgi:hypothetical protein